MKLGILSSIRTGLVFSRKEVQPENSSFKYRALSLSSVTEDGQILQPKIEDFFTNEALKKEYFTRSGDILLRLSTPYTVVLITDNETDLLVPAHFVIIRVINKGVVPRYLYWWLINNRKKLYKIASGGSMMGTISSGYIANIQFEPPPIKKQQQIANLHELAAREQRLLSALSDSKKQLMDAMLTIINDEVKI